jgi:hypothetical protein
MKTNNSIIKHPLSGRFRIALLCTTMTIAPLALQAHGGGGGGGRGGGFGGGFGGGHGGGFGGHVGGFARTESFAHSGNFAQPQSFARPETVSRESSMNAVQRAPEVARESARSVQTNSVQLQQHFDRLSQHSMHEGGTADEVRNRRDRLYRTRDYLFDLEYAGYPIDLLDGWYDALAQDEILVGMPTELLLDYWGNPVAAESVVLAGSPAQIWTYRVHPDQATRVTVVGQKVTAVHHA